MNGGSRCWASLPADALAHIINECGLCNTDVASVRLVCSHWRLTTNSHLSSLAPSCTSLEQVAAIAERFPFLTNCDLTRCDTSLVGHASLCRDASSRLSSLLASLSRMPSLTCLHISDTFSERMGQKHWASLVCAQALVASPPRSAARAAPEAAAEPPPLDAAAAAAATAAAAADATASAPSSLTAATAAFAAPVDTAVVREVGAALAAVSVDGSAAAGRGAALSGPLHDTAAITDGVYSSSGSVNDEAAGSCNKLDLNSRLPEAVSEPRQQHPRASGGLEVEVEVVPMAGGGGEDGGGAAAASAGPAEPPPRPAEAEQPPPPPPPLFLTTAELADPGIKSFARAISRPGATHQHAFWLPDWCGRLAGLQELHIRGRQRPTGGLAPCLLWLHVGRTAPQLTSLSLVRLSLVTLPEQLQRLTGLTRLVAQDCSLSLMPRGVAAGLSRLQCLDLSHNGLTALPSDFAHLISLQHLDLQRNKLAALPADIGTLTALTCLLLNNNQLRQLPPSLAALRAVQELSCSYNWLGGMGPSLPLLCGLPALRRLELACVSDVRCRLVPPQELRLLAGHLTHLDLAANNLVPGDVLGTLTSVRSLVLSDCGLLAVPPWVRRLAPSLHRLDLSNNCLSELPPWLSACTRLRHLSIASNRLSIRVPPAVLELMPQLEVVESE